jgi:23S rRNA pseudouridine1911/1915/1917 synthase
MDQGVRLNRRLTHRVKTTDGTKRLDQCAQQWLAQALGREVSRSEVRRLIMAGAIRMEGAPPRRPAIPVAAGRRLLAVLRSQSLRSRLPPSAPALSASDILFEDPWLVAVSKPPGIPTHETVDPRRPHLVALVAQLLSERTGGREVRLGIHQRLDRDTSGVILFTRDPAVDAALARQFAERKIAKTYHALTARPPRLPAGAWTVRSPISPRPGEFQEAETGFRLLEKLACGLLVEARPRTGRKHQIRVHLAESGAPILGDERYGRGEEGSKPPRLMLHASRLELLHPQSARPLVIESPWPADFRNLLARLRAKPPGGAAARARRSRR